MDKITKELEDFLKRKKFSNSEWKSRGLNPSSNEVCIKMSELLDNCCQKLIIHSRNNGTARNFRKELKKGLSSFKKDEYDTEEKEFICDYFHELSKIVNIDFKNDLNRWLYGSLLTGMLKIASLFMRSEKVIETLIQDCAKCNVKLETFITKKQDGIPDYSFDIVKCKACGEFNMIDKGPNIHNFHFGEYEPVEQLLKTEYTEEQVRIRLEQIKYWRK